MAESLLYIADKQIKRLKSLRAQKYRFEYQKQIQPKNCLHCLQNQPTVINRMNELNERRKRNIKGSNMRSLK